MAITNTSIDLEWSAATDNIAVTRYEIEKSTDGITFDAGINVGNVTSYTYGVLTYNTPYWFRISAFDAASNESNYSNIVTASTLPFLFFDDFTGTTIDTAKWVVDNTDADVTIAQNDTLNITTTGSSTGIRYADYVRAVDGIDLSNISALSFDLVANNATTTSDDWSCGITKDLNVEDNINRIAFQEYETSENGIKTNVRESSVNSSVNITSGVDWKSSSRTFKIVVSGSSVTFKIWSGSSWTTLSTDTHSLSGTFYPYFGCRSFLGDILNVSVDNFYVTDSDFTTQYP